MNKNGSICSKRPGSALALVMLAVALLMTIGIGVVALGMQGRMLAVRTSVDIAARAAADASIASAIHQMNEKIKIDPWDDSSLPCASNVQLISCDATLSYNVTKDNGIYTVHGTGKANNKTRSITTTLWLYSPFDFAVFARDYVDLKSGTYVDWYNNDSNDFPLQVGTSSIVSGAISLKSGTTINGDVVVGIGANPADVIIGEEAANITGDIYSMTYNPVLPSITAPDYLITMSSSGSIVNPVTISASAKYDEIDLGNNEIITITEPVAFYVTGDITFGNSAGIKIGGPLDTDNDASLTIYLAGDLEGKNGTGFNNLTSNSWSLSLYCLDTCQAVDFKNSSDFYGTIYAPEASIELDNSADIYGSIIGETFDLKNSATVYYDASLRDKTVSDELVRFIVHRWAEQ